MRALVHIGMEKVGSTSIQAWKTLNAAKFADDGIFCLAKTARNQPDMSLHRAAGHVALHDLSVAPGEAMQRIDPAIRDRLGPIIGGLDDELHALKDGSGVFFASCEHLFAMTRGQIRGIEAYLSRFFSDRVYVVYIRDPVDWLVSHYSQGLRSGCDGWFDDHLNPAKGARNRIQGIWRQLCTWRDTVGGRLNVRLVEPDFLSDGDLIKDIASVIGSRNAEPPGRFNEGIAAEYVEYVRQMNERCRVGERPGTQEQIRKYIIGRLSSLSSGKPRLAASASQAEAIVNETASILELVRQAFFPERPVLILPKARSEGIKPWPLTDERKTTIDMELAEHMLDEIWSSK